jgi:hypothetical protein
MGHPVVQFFDSASICLPRHRFDVGGSDLIGSFSQYFGFEAVTVHAVGLQMRDNFVLYLFAKA